MVRFFDAIDRFLSGVIPVPYLLGTSTGTILYFGGWIPSTPFAVGTSPVLESPLRAITGCSSAA